MLRLFILFQLCCVRVRGADHYSWWHSSHVAQCDFVRPTQYLLACGLRQLVRLRDVQQTDRLFPRGWRCHHPDWHQFWANCISCAGHCGWAHVSRLTVVSNGCDMHFVVWVHHQQSDHCVASIRPHVCPGSLSLLRVLCAVRLRPNAQRIQRASVRPVPHRTVQQHA